LRFQYFKGIKDLEINFNPKQITIQGYNDLGNYISRDKIYDAQKAFFKEKFPTLSDNQIAIKIRKAEELAGK